MKKNMITNKVQKKTIKHKYLLKRILLFFFISQFNTSNSIWPNIFEEENNKIKLKEEIKACSIIFSAVFIISYLFVLYKLTKEYN
jgi:hypothetical protein